MIRLEGFFKNGDFTITEKKEVKSESNYEDHLIIKAITERKKNIYYRYFETIEELKSWLNSLGSVTNINF